MKLGVITYQKVKNYGADLQAYALQAKLKGLGYEVKNIDYLHYKHPRFKATQKSKRIIPLPLITRIKARMFPWVVKIRELKNRALSKKRAELFESFERDFIECTEEYTTIDRLYKSPPEFDVYIAGSDQIWNPRSDTSMAPYFLDFAPPGAKCISYASSFGVSELPGAAFYQTKKMLKRFSAVSVREKSGLRLIKAMSLNVETKHVLDPTLLLSAEEWQSVEKRPEDFKEEKFLLLYDLIASPEAVDLAQRWADGAKCPVVRIADGAYGPSEFIWLFHHAAAVVTTSFHGTVFSVLNRKPFYSVIPSHMTNSSRIESLLSMLGLSKRTIHASKCSSLRIDASINYDDVETRLICQRKDSVDFLTRAIEEPSRENKSKEPLATYACWNKNEEIRANSTSGGLFRVFAEYVIKDNGLVFGAAFTEDLKTVRHVKASTVEELSKLMKSKYVWSDPANAYKEAVEALKDGRKVLFSGTPCQVAVINKLAEGCSDNLLTLDFVCHGTPEPKVWKSYVEEMEKKHHSSMTEFEFRNKDKGWNFQNIVYSFANGKRYRVIPWNDPYFHGFSINAFLRPACYECSFAHPDRPSDFTIADCWRVASSHPRYDDNKGTSLVLVNTEKAKKLWDEILGSSLICGGKYDFNLAQMRNSALMNPAREPSCRSKFESVFKETNSFNAASRTYLSWKKTLKYSLMYYVKRWGWLYFKKHQ